MRVLHLLSQRPGRTGSGITLDALVRHAAAAGHEQEVVVGTPANDPSPEVGGLPAACVHPLRFGRGSLDFAVPGMSDVMPYASRRFASLDAGERERYAEAWRDHLAPVIDAFRPDVIHTHHVWLLSALVKDVAPRVPVVVHAHATGARQMRLCPHLAGTVREGCRRNEGLVVLTHAQRAEYAALLDRDVETVDVVGAGYRADLFHARGRGDLAEGDFLYVGKYSRAKGLPWLLDAWERLATRDPRLRLHLVGSGSGEEAERLARRAAALAPGVVCHGALDQAALAERMRATGVLVLPSLYEGLPLVVVEALACGARVVCTALPAVTGELACLVGGGLDLVELPRLEHVDRPREEDVSRFVDGLETALEHARHAPRVAADPGLLADFTWEAVFRRVERVWIQASRSGTTNTGGIDSPAH